MNDSSRYMKDSSRIVIAVGGTGGHIYPAVALAQQLKQYNRNIDLLFVGGNLASNPYFSDAGYPYREIPCSTINAGTPHRTLWQMGRIAKGVWESRKILREFSPDLVVGFGSYHALPSLIAAMLARIPLILHEQNSIPGRVNRLLSRFAKVTGTHFPESNSYLRGQVIEVGIPLRAGYRDSKMSRAQALGYFELGNTLPTLLVFGGSQGAQAINEQLLNAVELGLLSNMQIIHLTGRGTSSVEIKNIYTKFGIRACVKEFETRMDFAWRAADCVMSRSGAGTIAEQVEFEVPGILIPWPKAMDNHQEKNADFMVNQVGGAVKLTQKGLTPYKISEQITWCMQQDHLSKMQTAIKKYKDRRPKEDLCAVVTHFLETGKVLQSKLIPT